MTAPSRAAALRPLVPVALLDGLAAAVIVGFGLSRGWTTPAPFGLACLLAGCAFLAFGVLSFRSQKLRDDDPRPLLEQQRLYGRFEMIRHNNRLDRPQAQTLMGICGSASLPLLAFGLLLRFVL